MKPADDPASRTPFVVAIATLDCSKVGLQVTHRCPQVDAEIASLKARIEEQDAHNATLIQNETQLKGELRRLQVVAIALGVGLFAQHFWGPVAGIVGAAIGFITGFVLVLIGWIHD